MKFVADTIKAGLGKKPKKPTYFHSSRKRLILIKTLKKNKAQPFRSYKDRI